MNMVFDKTGKGGSWEKARLARLVRTIFVAYVEPKRVIFYFLAGNSPVQPLPMCNGLCSLYSPASCGGSLSPFIKHQLPLHRTLQTSSSNYCKLGACLNSPWLQPPSEVQNKMIFMGHEISSCHVLIVRSFFIYFKIISSS